MTSVPRWISGHYRHITARGMLAALAVGGVLAIGALFGVGWIAGLRAIFSLLGNVQWQWLPLAMFFIGVSHLGYTFAYREVAQPDNGTKHPLTRVGFLVVAGFGMLIPRAGFTLDRGLWRDHGHSESSARHSVMTIGMLEYGVLGPGAFVAAIVLLLRHYPAQSGVLTSWLIGLPAGALVTGALFLVRGKLPDNRLVRPIHQALDAVAATVRLARSRHGVLAIGGMAVYWSADIASLGVCLAMVGHGATLSVPALVVAYASGYALTRRSLPLAGAGAAEALMPFAMHWMDVALGAAVLAVFLYRLGNLWLPLAPAAAAVRWLQLAAPATE